MDDLIDWSGYDGKADSVRLDQEYKDWRDNANSVEIDEDQLKRDLYSELKMLKKMSAEDYELWKKWHEVNEYADKDKYMVEENKILDRLESMGLWEKPDDYGTISFSHDDTGKISLLRAFYGQLYPQFYKKLLWVPEKPEDYLKLEPELVLAKNNENEDVLGRWTLIRTFCSRAIYSPSPGRNIRFVVQDKVTKKCLGVIGLSSDFAALTPRDKYIGWTKEIKRGRKKIDHTCIGSTIVPTSPLGPSFVGGKLISLLTLSDPVIEAWEQKYPDKLVGISTTGLYGSFSQYTGLTPYWKSMGSHPSSVCFKPSRESEMRMKQWLMNHNKKKYFEWHVATGDKGNPLITNYRDQFLQYVYRKLGLDHMAKTSHERGVYFSELYENTRPFLRDEIKEDQLGNKRFNGSVEHLTELWKQKYAKKRVESQLEKGKYSTKTLFYWNLMYRKTWDEVKNRSIEREIMETKKSGDCGICCFAMVADVNCIEASMFFKEKIFEDDREPPLVNKLEHMKKALDLWGIEYEYLKSGESFDNLVGDIALLYVKAPGYFRHWVIYLPKEGYIIDPDPTMPDKVTDFKRYKTIQNYFSITEKDF